MKWLFTIVVVLALAALGWWWYDAYYTSANNAMQEAATGNVGGDENTSAETEATDQGIGEVPMEATVILTDEGFSPKSVTVHKGGTVTFLNESGGQMWVGSAQHPTHTTYAGTTLSEHCEDEVDISFDQCGDGSTYSFTFEKAGTWNYHNHLKASQFGSVVVVE